MEDSVNKTSHGRYAVPVTYTSNVYEAESDGADKPIPFQLNCSAGGVVSVLLVDSDVYQDVYFNPGDNPSLLIGVSDSGAMNTGLVAMYPYKPATTTINTTY